MSQVQQLLSVTTHSAQTLRTMRRTAETLQQRLSKGKALQLRTRHERDVAVERRSQLQWRRFVLRYRLRASQRASLPLLVARWVRRTSMSRLQASWARWMCATDMKPRARALGVRRPTRSECSQSRPSVLQSVVQSVVQSGGRQAQITTHKSRLDFLVRAAAGGLCVLALLRSTTRDHTPNAHAHTHEHFTHKQYILACGSSRC